MLDTLLQQVKDAVLHHSNQQNQQPGPFDPSGLLGSIQGLFGQHAANNPQYGNVLSSSQDQYGDPADQSGQMNNVRPASEDRYGDPADQR